MRLVRVAIWAALLLVGCSDDRQRPPLASGDCRVPPCKQPAYHGGGTTIADSGADAADGR